jgi:hypothetical protein
MKKAISSWTIYIWQNEDKIEACAPVVTRDGVKTNYCMGWEIEKVPDVKRNETKHQIWRAKVQVKNVLNNTLNVINWYGKKVLDEKGEIDPEKLRYCETASAMQAFKSKVDISDLYPIKKFPVKNITPQKAKEYKFI